MIHQTQLPSPCNMHVCYFRQIIQREGERVCERCMKAKVKRHNDRHNIHDIFLSAIIIIVIIYGLL